MSRRPFLIAALVAVLLAAGIYESRVRPAARERTLPTGAAEWIWASDLGAEEGWVNFFLYRDFDLGERIPETADLVVRADAGYWAFVNQHAVGSGVFRERSEADSYDIARFLRPGGNRIVIQVRSRRGVGGLIANLRLDSERAVGTDLDWKSSRRYESALLRNGFVPEDVGTVKVWGSPPVGAWPVGMEAAATPLLARQLLDRDVLEATRVRPLGELDWEKRFPPAADRSSLGRWVSFDLGRSVNGYLNVVFAGSRQARGLVYTSLERATGPDTDDPATYFLSPAGRVSWTDLQPREFRFVTVLALADIAGLRVFETAPEWVVARGAGEIRPRRAFSFAPPASAATVEDEFRRELKRVTGLTGAEAFESSLSGSGVGTR